MHILALLLAVLGGAAFWWWRLKMMGEAASEVTDVAGRAWGKYKRLKFRKKSDASVFDAVEDPAAAAVIMMIAIAQEEQGLTPATETAIDREVSETMGIEDRTELMVFSKWVAQHVEDANNVSLRYNKLWTSKLSPDERRDLLAMVKRVAEASGPASPAVIEKIRKLNERLGLGG
jgi:uncharacterized tellurite resistance protein B-like protein